MALIYETSTLGFSVRVFTDRVDYKRGFMSSVESIPIGAIASVKPASFLANKLVIEIGGGRQYTLITSRKKEVAEAIYQARSSLRMAPIASAVPRTLRIADELEKLARLCESGFLSQVEFESQKAALLGGGRQSSAALQATAHVYPTPTSKSSPIGRILKRIGLGMLACFILIIMIGSIVGPAKKKTSAGSPVATSPNVSFSDYKIELTNHPKEKEGDDGFREVDVVLGHLPDRTDVLDALMRSVLDTEVKKDDSVDILAMAFVGDEVVGQPKWAGNLIYRASTKTVTTLDADQGLKTQRIDDGRFLLEVSEGKTAKGITPVSRWIDLSFVFPVRPSDVEVYKIVMEEAAKHRGIERHAYVYVGDKANGMTWREVEDQDGKFMACTFTTAGQVTEASAVFASRRH